MDEHQKTILDIEADASRVVQVGEAMEKALAPGPVERFTDRMRGLDAVFESVLKKQIDLSLHLERVDRGTDAYRRLKDELREVAQAAKNVGDALGETRGGGAPPAAGGGAGADAGVTPGAATAPPGAAPPTPPPSGTPGGIPATAQERRVKAWQVGIANAFGSAAGGQAGLGMLAARMHQLGVATASGLPYGVGVIPGAMMIGGAASLQRAGQAVGAAEQFFGARMRAYPFVGEGVDEASRAGQPYGLGPTQTLGVAGGLFQAIGGQGGPQKLRLALAAQQLGIDPGTTGGFLRTFRPGRGNIDEGNQGNLLAEAIGGAEAQGLRGSEQNEYIVRMVNMIQGIGAGGGRISGRGVVGLASHLGTLVAPRGEGSAFLGQRGMQVATGMTQAAYQAGTTGPKDAIDIALLQEAGWKGGGGEEYAAALFKMQTEPEKLWPGAIQRMVRGIQGKGMQAVMAQRILGSRGISVNPEEAGALARGTVSPWLAEMFAATAGTRTGEGLIATGRAAARAGGAGVPQGRAALQAREIGVGAPLIQVQFTLERAQLTAASAAGVLKNELEALAKGVEEISKLTANAARTFKSALATVGKAAERVGEFLAQSPSEMRGAGVEPVAPIGTFQ